MYILANNLHRQETLPLAHCEAQISDFLRHIQHILVIQLSVMESTPAPPLSMKTVNGVLEISFTDIGWYFWIVTAIRSKWLSVCPWIYRWSWKSLNHTRMAGHQRLGWRFWHTKPFLSKSRWTWSRHSCKQFLSSFFLAMSKRSLRHGLSALRVLWQEPHAQTPFANFFACRGEKLINTELPIIPVQFRFGIMQAPSVWSIWSCCQESSWRSC